MSGADERAGTVYDSPSFAASTTRSSDAPFAGLPEELQTVIFDHARAAALEPARLISLSRPYLALNRKRRFRHLSFEGLKAFNRFLRLNHAGSNQLNKLAVKLQVEEGREDEEEDVREMKEAKELFKGACFSTVELLKINKNPAAYQLFSTFPVASASFPHLRRIHLISAFFSSALAFHPSSLASLFKLPILEELKIEQGVELDAPLPPPLNFPSAHAGLDWDVSLSGELTNTGTLGELLGVFRAIKDLSLRDFRPRSPFANSVLLSSLSSIQPSILRSLTLHGVSDDLVTASPFLKQCASLVFLSLDLPLDSDSFSSALFPLIYLATLKFGVSCEPSLSDLLSLIARLSSLNRLVLNLVVHVQECSWDDLRWEWEGWTDDFEEGDVAAVKAAGIAAGIEVSGTAIDAAMGREAYEASLECEV